MMGDRLVMQESLFYQFRLDDHVPADHMLRAIDRFLDLDRLRRHLAPFYSTTGRPSIDRASKFDCTTCLLKVRCCPKEPVRKIPRSILERSRDVARSLVGTELYERSRRERKKIEMLFAHLKRIMGLRRLRLR